MAKNRKEKKIVTSGIGHNPVRGIFVFFTLESLQKICRDTKTQIMCYGDVALADTMAMNKIITALAENKDSVII